MIFLFYCFFNVTATTEIYTVLTHSFPTRRSSDLNAAAPQRWPLPARCRSGRACHRGSGSRDGSAARQGRVPGTGRPWRVADPCRPPDRRSEEHTSELQSLMRISYAVFCLKKKNKLVLVIY